MSTGLLISDTLNPPFAVVIIFTSFYMRCENYNDASKKFVTQEQREGDPLPHGTQHHAQGKESKRNFVLSDFPPFPPGNRQKISQNAKIYINLISISKNPTKVFNRYFFFFSLHRCYLCEARSLTKNLPPALRVGMENCLRSDRSGTNFLTRFTLFLQNFTVDSVWVHQGIM